MSEPSFRKPRLSGPGAGLWLALLGVVVIIALGFAIWGLAVYPNVPTATPMPVIGTLTAIARGVSDRPTEVATQPLPSATSTGAGLAEATVVPTDTPQPTTVQPTATATPTAAEGKTPSPQATATPTAPPALPTATVTPVPATDTPVPPTATPAVSTVEPLPPPATNAFGYGIQSHMIGVGHEDTVDAIQDLGFQWLKQQIEWKKFEVAEGQYDWAEIDRLVETCNENGIYLLLSVVKAPDWARGPNPDTSVEGPPANPQDFADFVGAMATRHRGRIHAYEIWNEQNLHYEWGNEQLDAARYVRLLAAAYSAIKAADPQALVISGALTPTGGDGGVRAVEDATYLRQMYQAGFQNYCDAVGAHPSGYNIPPGVEWQTYQDPSAGFRGLWDTPHYSWSFRGVLETYRQIMVENGDAGRLIWVTEFGWAVESEPPAGREYAADNTLSEQRDWTVRAFQMGKSWGWVGPMFLWNLNFRQIVPWSEQGMWSILAYDGSPLPVYIALRDMPK